MAERTIVVGTDGSPGGRRALDRALHMAVLCARLRPPLGAYPPCDFRTSTNRLEMSLTTGSGARARDADGRQALIDCGAALLNARVVFAREELIATVARIPVGPAAGLFARIDVRSPGPDEPIPDARLTVLADRLRRASLEKGRTQDVDLPRVVTARLAAAAAQENAVLVRVARPDHLAAIDRLQRQVAEPSDEGAERWPHSGTARLLPAQRRAPAAGTVLLLGTRRNRSTDWLRTGEALQRVRLELARLDVVGRPLADLSSAPDMWIGLRRALSLDFSPQILIRILADHDQENPAQQGRYGPY